MVGTFDKTIQQFAYSDSWYAVTDGEGLSLTIRDDSATLDAWSLKEGWKASSRSGGSPGAADVSQTPGDTDADNDVDLADLNNVRNHFGESGAGVIGDTNGDQVVNLVDLNAVRNNFGAGQPLRFEPQSQRRRPIPEQALAADHDEPETALRAIDAVFAQLTIPSNAKKIAWRPGKGSST